MHSHGGEQVVLDAIEGQLRTEDPQLVACFFAFNSVIPPTMPPNGWYDPSPRRKHRRTDPPAHGDVVKVVIVACVLVAAIAGTKARLRMPSNQ